MVDMPSNQTKPNQSKTKTCTVYGEGNVNNQMCQNQFAKFSAIDSSLNNAPLWSRLFKIDSNQIMRIISVLSFLM